MSENTVWAHRQFVKALDKWNFSKIISIYIYMNEQETQFLKENNSEWTFLCEIELKDY